jgi:hypothetical protein
MVVGDVSRLGDTVSGREGDPETEHRTYREDWIDTAFALLADGRRRFVLAYLQDCREATLPELANVVTGWEQTRDGRGVASCAERDRNAARLHHVDLPRLAAAGVVAYDQHTGRVELVDLPPPLGDLLAIATDSRRPDDRNRERSTTGRRR